MQINQNPTWDLTDLFADTAAWESQLEEIHALANTLASRRGKLATDGNALLDTITIQCTLGEKAERAFVYAYSTLHTDMSAAASRTMVGKLEMQMTAIAEQIAFVEPELMQYSYEDFRAYCAACPALIPFDTLMRDLYEHKAHVLDDAGEIMLTRISDLGETYRQVFDDLTVNDTPDGEIQAADGTSIPVNEAGYGAALQNPDRAIRRAYYDTLLSMYGGHIRTLSSSYAGKVKADMYLAKSRRYPSARAAALAGNFIPEAVYDTLVSTVRQNIAPMEEYIALRKRVLRIDDFRFYDFFVPLVADVAREYSYEEAAALTIKATAPLGADYGGKLLRALENRWTDVYAKPNKQTGAYSTSAYGCHPYVLLNYDNTLSDVFTVAHELGHSLHSLYSAETQPYCYADYSIFCAEVASTTNEQLLYHYLLENAESDALRTQLLAKHLDDLRSTFYRQTMFAEFESRTHQMAEAGEPLTPDTLCALHQQLNRDYYGAGLIVDDALGYEWARIPHYYNGFYVYQYATGISAAIAISRRIASGAPEATAGYRAFLSGGSSQHPIELLRLAGVDMASPQPVLDTIEEFKSTLAALQKLI